MNFISRECAGFLISLSLKINLQKLCLLNLQFERRYKVRSKKVRLAFVSLIKFDIPLYAVEQNLRQDPQSLSINSQLSNSA